MLPTMFPVARRTVLLAPLAAVASYLLAGCTDAATSPAPSDPEREALTTALNLETELRQLAGRWIDAVNTTVNRADRGCGPDRSCRRPGQDAGHCTTSSSSFARRLPARPMTHR